MIKRGLSSLLALVCVTALLFVTAATAFAHGAAPRAATLSPNVVTLPATVQAAGNQGTGYTVDIKTLSPSALAFSHLLVSTTLLKEFTFQNGQLGLAEPIATLTAHYHLNSSDVQYIDNMLAFSKTMHAEVATSLGVGPTDTVANPAAPNVTGQHSVSPYLSVHNWTIYFTNWDVTAFLLAAAQAGVWAMAGALTWIASIFGGPVGTVIGVVLAIIGVPTLAAICYNVMQAGWTHRGLYIGVQWNWWWPNVVVGVW